MAPNSLVSVPEHRRHHLHLRHQHQFHATVWVGVALAASAVTLAACGSPHKAPSYPSGVAPITKTTVATGKPVHAKTTTPTTKTTAPTTTAPTTTPTAQTVTPTTPAIPVTTTRPIPEASTTNPTALATKGSPAWVAGRFVALSHLLEVTWTGPDEWVELAKPYVAPSYYPTLLATTRQQTENSYNPEWAKAEETQVGQWAQVVETHVTGHPPPTATSCFVIVHFLVGGIAPSGKRDPAEQQNTPIVLPMTKVSGTWYVDGPASPNYGT